MLQMSEQGRKMWVQDASKALAGFVGVFPRGCCGRSVKNPQKAFLRVGEIDCKLALGRERWRRIGIWGA